MGTPIADPVEFGKRVRAVRSYLGLSREAFADLTGISRAKIKRLEDGEVGKRGWSEMEKRGLAEFLTEKSGLPREYFDGETGDSGVTAEQLNARLEEARPLLELLNAPGGASIDAEARAALADLDRHRGSGASQPRRGGGRAADA